MRYALALPAAATMLVVLWTSAVAHHGPPNNVLYDLDNIVELEGQVTELFWRNPHVRFRLEHSDGQVWEIESGPVTWLSRLGWSSDVVNIGDRVRVAGYVSKRRKNEMALTNMLLPNGLEFTGSGRPRELRFAEDQLAVNRSEIPESVRQQAIASATGIFRTWAWGVGEFGGGGTPDNEESMLTPAAIAARLSFNLLTDEPVLDCVQDGMPRAMFHPTVAEFSDEDDRIIYRSHEHDIVRTIHMASAGDPARQPESPLGYSVGEWDGDTLLVTTTRISWHLSDEEGTPQSPDVRLVERFTPSEDGSRLNYELTATDPPYLTGPSKRTAEFVWVPGLTLEPYECEIWERD